MLAEAVIPHFEFKTLDEAEGGHVLANGKETTTRVGNARVRNRIQTAEH